MVLRRNIWRLTSYGKLFRLMEYVVTCVLYRIKCVSPIGSSPSSQTHGQLHAETSHRPTRERGTEISNIKSINVNQITINVHNHRVHIFKFTIENLQNWHRNWRKKKPRGKIIFSLTWCVSFLHLSLMLCPFAPKLKLLRYPKIDVRVCLIHKSARSSFILLRFVYKTK